MIKLSVHNHIWRQLARVVKWLISLIPLIAVLMHILFVFLLQVDVVGPLLLYASLLLVLTTDYSDWLVQVDIVGPLLLNASLLLVLTTDYSDWLVQITKLLDGQSFEFWRVCDWIILNWLIKLICFYLISEIKFLKWKKWLKSFYQR